MRKHGHAKRNKPTTAYNSWAAMKQRCLNPKSKFFKDYGGRGIEICEKWHSFEGFFEDMGVPPDGRWLERIENSKGYCKENCRWATASEQCRNRRSNINITFNGETKCLTDWAIALGFRYATVYARLKKGWPVSLAFSSNPKI